MNLVQTPPWRTISLEPEEDERTRTDLCLWSSQEHLVVASTVGHFYTSQRRVK